jgi:hypothetical protein
MAVEAVGTYGLFQIPYPFLDANIKTPATSMTFATANAKAAIRKSVHIFDARVGAIYMEPINVERISRY